MLQECQGGGDTMINIYLHTEWQGLYIYIDKNGSWTNNHAKQCGSFILWATIIAQHYLDAVGERLGAHDILETCDLTGVSQTGYDAICKKLKSRVRASGKGLRIGYHPSPYQVSILRRELNGNMKDLIGNKQCIDHSSFTSTKERAKLWRLHWLKQIICLLTSRVLKEQWFDFTTLLLGGCTVYYVWEPRAFMTPPKNPLIYERLYV